MIALAYIVGGFLGVWLLQGIIDWAVTSRVMDDPLKGKMLATILAFFLASFLYWMSSGSPSGFGFYLPGAFIVGLLEVRSARKVQERIDAADDTATFE